MFGQLKNKLSGFVDKLIGRKETEPSPKDEKKPEIQIEKEVAPEVLEKVDESEIKVQPEIKEEIVEKKSEVEPEIKTEKRPEITVEQKPEPKTEIRVESEVISAFEKKDAPEAVRVDEEKKLEGKKPEEKIVHVSKIEKKFNIKKKISPPQEANPQVKEIVIEAKEAQPEEPVELVALEKKEKPKMPVEIGNTLEEIVEQKEIEEGRTEKPKSQVVEKKSVFDIAKSLFIKKEEKAAFEKVTESVKEKKKVEDVRFEKLVLDSGSTDIERLEKKALDGKKDMGVKVGVAKSLGGFFSPTITVEKKDVEDLLDELELSLIEADVGLEVSEEVKKRLEQKLVGLKVDKSKMQQQVNLAIKAVLVEVMTPKNTIDFEQKLKSAKKPAKLLFVGPNGAGKTTTIAKIANMLEKKGMSVCMAAADTFRAAAIEQLSVHAQRLNVPIIKSEYGADPASVAFDAVKYAKAHDIDAVLIDSAGRQDTNANLIDEMKKIERVVSPDLKIYVGESIGGSALIEQIRAFHDAIGIDGAILTKLDCDAKGGTAISLSYTTGVPILFLGVGQKYEDLRPFDSDEVADQILS